MKKVRSRRDGGHVSGMGINSFVGHLNEKRRGDRKSIHRASIAGPKGLGWVSKELANAEKKVTKLEGMQLCHWPIKRGLSALARCYPQRAPRRIIN